MSETRGSRDPGASAQHLRVLTRQSARTTRARAELLVSSLNNRRKEVAGFRYREVRRKDKMKKNNETKLRHWIGSVLRRIKKTDHRLGGTSVKQFLRIFVIKWCNWALNEETRNWDVNLFHGTITVPESLRECLKQYTKGRLATDFQLFCDIAWDMRYVPEWLCTKWKTIELPLEVQDDICPWTGNGNHIVRQFAKSLSRDAKAVGGKFMYSCTEYAYDSDMYVLVLPKGKKLTWSTTTRVNGIITEKKEIEIA